MGVQGGIDQAKGSGTGKAEFNLRGLTRLDVQQRSICPSL